MNTDPASLAQLDQAEATLRDYVDGLVYLVDVCLGGGHTRAEVAGIVAIQMAPGPCNESSLRVLVGWLATEVALVRRERTLR